MSAQITPFIYQVPTARRLVFRNVWRSRSDDPGKPIGYRTSHEGYSFWLPILWHTPVALVDMRPIARDARDYQVNTMDGQRVFIDVRTIDRVKPKLLSSAPDVPEVGEDVSTDSVKEEFPGDPVYRYAIQVESEGELTRDKLIQQVLTKALNVATSGYTAVTYMPEDLKSDRDVDEKVPEGDQPDADESVDQEDNEGKEHDTDILKKFPRLKTVPRRYWDWLYDTSKEPEDKESRKRGLAELDARELEVLSGRVKKIANKELAMYGLEFVETSVQRISLSGSLAKALKRRAAAGIEVSTAGQERDAARKMIEALSEDSRTAFTETVVLVANRAFDTLRDIFGYSQTGPTPQSLEEQPASVDAEYDED